MLRWLAAWTIIAVITTTIQADTYVIPPDYHVACLDLTTGKQLWITSPGRLSVPKLSVQDDVVFVSSTIHNSEKTEEVKYWLDFNTGKTLAESDASEAVQPLKPLNRNLITSDGTILEFDAGNTRHLYSVSGGRQRLIQRLDSYPGDLHVFNNLAVFTFCSGIGAGDTGGGEVYAFNVSTKSLQWEFDASSVIPNLAEFANTDIDIDGDRVIVSTNQTIIALDAQAGRVLWTTELPRQTLRRYDSPWTNIGRHGDLLIVTCYEDLFALRALDGKLLWSFDCGPFGAPWPTIDQNRAVVGVRKGTPRQGSASFPGRQESESSALVVFRDENSPSGYTIEFMSRRSIPRGEKIWWSLKTAPLPVAKPDKHVMITLIEDFDGRHSETKLEITEPLREAGKAYVKFGRWIDKAVLEVDGKEVVSKIKPGSPLARVQR